MNARAGAGLGVLVNANAKRGGRRVAVQISRALPGANVRLTRSKGEIDDWLRSLPKMRAILAAGGDGTAIALMNAMDRVFPEGELPTMGVLPLGTGNGWAHALGSPKLHLCLELLAKNDALPTRRCGMVDVDGTLAHFVGTGWDAMILEDYKRQLEASKGPGRTFSKSVYGYISATVFLTAPKVTLHGNPRVLVENLGDKVYCVNDDGVPWHNTALGRGDVLYDGPVGISGAATCPEFGYRFRAFPFAERVPGMISVRVYDRGAPVAVASMHRLWRGEHPLGGMHDWIATHVRMTFSRPVPFQIGGDASGYKRTVEYRIADRSLRMVDWKRMLSL